MNQAPQEVQETLLPQMEFYNNAKPSCAWFGFTGYMKTIRTEYSETDFQFLIMKNRFTFLSSFKKGHFILSSFLCIKTTGPAW